MITSCTTTPSWLGELRERAQEGLLDRGYWGNRKQASSDGSVTISTRYTQVRVEQGEDHFLFYKYEDDGHFDVVAMAPRGDRGFVSHCQKGSDISSPPPGRCWELFEVPAKSAIPVVGLLRRFQGMRRLAQMENSVNSMDVTPDGRTLDVATGRSLQRYHLAGSNTPTYLSLPEGMDSVTHLADGTVVLYPCAHPLRVSYRIGSGSTLHDDFPRALYVVRPGEEAVTRVPFKDAFPSKQAQGLTFYAEQVPEDRREEILRASPLLDADGVLPDGIPENARFSPQADAMVSIGREHRWDDHDILLWDSQGPPRALLRWKTGWPEMRWTAAGRHVVLWERDTRKGPVPLAIAPRDGRSVLLPAVEEPSVEGDVVCFKAAGQEHRLRVPEDLADLERQPWYQQMQEAELQKLCRKALGQESPPPPARPGASQGVIQEADWVTVGGVRVPKRRPEGA